jgi:hypothetical protein
MHTSRFVNLRKKYQISGGLPSLQLVSIQDMNILVVAVKHGFTTTTEF